MQGQFVFRPVTAQCELKPKLYEIHTEGEWNCVWLDMERFFSGFCECCSAQTCTAGCVTLNTACLPALVHACVWHSICVWVRVRAHVCVWTFLSFWAKVFPSKLSFIFLLLPLLFFHCMSAFPYLSLAQQQAVCHRLFLLCVCLPAA